MAIAFKKKVNIYPTPPRGNSGKWGKIWGYWFSLNGLQLDKLAKAGPRANQLPPLPPLRASSVDMCGGCCCWPFQVPFLAMRLRSLE